jgi:hypothetical protein
MLVRAWQPEPRAVSAELKKELLRKWQKLVTIKGES